MILSVGNSGRLSASMATEMSLQSYITF